MATEKHTSNPTLRSGGNIAPIGRNSLIGIAFMLAASICNSAMHTTISYASDTVHPLIMVFFRLLFALIVVIPFFIRDGLAPLKTSRLGMLILRGVLNICAISMFFNALSLSPLVDITALSFTAPLFATVLAALFLRERLGWRSTLAIVSGFCGTLIVLRPGFAEISLGYGLVLMSSMIWGGCVVIIKELSRTESSVTITTYMSLVMAPLALIPALYVWQTPTYFEFVLLVVIGVFGGGGQLFMAQALKYAETHVVMPFDYLRLLWVTMTGLVLFGQVPTLFVWLGGSVIFASTAYITLRERRKRLKQSDLT
jgi:drug/metabolite transporter (DMT)-like permease